MDVGLVCDGCSAFNELGTATCASCQRSISLDGVDGSIVQEAAVQEASMKSCSMCGADVVQGNRFCGACGNPLGEVTRSQSSPKPPPKRDSPSGSPSGGLGKKTLFFSSIQAAKAKLVLIRGEGHDGESYALAGQDHRIGRSDADIIFDEDPFLSPTHVNFFYVAGKLVVADEGSVNGVYIRIRGTRPIHFDDHFLVGEQVMQVKRLDVDMEMRPTADGTYLYSSPKRPARFKLEQVLHGGARGLAFVASSDVASLGREGNDINFPDDPFISGHHAQVASQGKELTLTDLGSKNGTFIRITEQTPLEHGDYVFMGQQLLRVEIV